MPDEFILTVSFKMDSRGQLRAMQDLIELFHLCETDAARSLLRSYFLDSAQLKIETLTSQFSTYTNEDDLVEMFADSYNDSVDDMQFETNESGAQGFITVQGQDREADDFCAALVLLLLAMGARDIHAKASAAMWNGSWESDATNVVQLEFTPAE